jgi:gliding motility-associated-like protein
MEDGKWVSPKFYTYAPMKKALFSLALALWGIAPLLAQPAPCGTPASMTSTCAPACVVCDIDGFTGINDNPASGVGPFGFCTTTVHHIQWIAFIAGSTDLTLSVSVTNCQNAAFQENGLEVGIYYSLNCQNFQLVSNCNGDILNNTTATFTNTVPLIVGQYYYFVMDGNGGDVCNYTIHVVEGSTLVSPLDTSGVIQGPTEFCKNVAQTFTTTGETGAAHYAWTLDGATAGTGQSFDLEVATPGSYELCVTASNACDVAPKSCTVITVTELPPTQVVENICAGECVEIADSLICVPGSYSFHLFAQDGCDSIVNAIVQLNLPVVTNLEVNICEGDTIFVGGNPYFTVGQFTENLLTWRGCDSIVNLDLGLIVCEIEGDALVGNVSCFGANDGQLVFAVEDGTPPLQYTWQNIGTGTPAGQGIFTAVNDPDTLNQLPPGTYLIHVSDNFGNDLVLIGEVTQPPRLIFDGHVSDYNGFSVECTHAQNGSITALPEGGTPPYAFNWSNSDQTDRLDSLTAGAYALTITDANGCSIAGSFLLTEPPPLQISGEFEDPTCKGLTTGIVSVSHTSGGIPPYDYSLNNSTFGDSTVFRELGSGTYVLAVRDLNNCTATVSGSLQAPAIPVIELGTDLTIQLGENIPLHIATNIPLEMIGWENDPGLSCYNCLNPIARPFNTTLYTVEVSSEDDCTATDSITVNVLKIRDVYVPNVFSPNNDGINDTWAVFGGGAVERILTLKVFSRWGSLVFDGKDLAPNDLKTGWDGRFKDKAVHPDVFAWYAEVLFIDGEVVKLEGDLTVVR